MPEFYRVKAFDRGTKEEKSSQDSMTLNEVKSEIERLNSENFLSEVSQVSSTVTTIKDFSDHDIHE